MSEDIPVFQKHDRYKAGTYRTYNFRMPTRYDSSWWTAFCDPLWDHTVIAELGSGIESLAILDVGCATGRLLSSLVGAGGRQLCGVDLAPNIIEVACEKLARQGARAELRVADAEQSLPWPDQSFDVVTLTGVLHHFYRPLDALGEIYRVLRVEGRLVVVDPDFFTPLRQVINVCLRVVPHEGDYKFYSRKKAMVLLELAGFRCSRSGRCGFGAYFILASRSGRRHARCAARLVLVDSESGWESSLQEGEAVVGRGQESTVVLNDPTVARRHARVVVEKERAWVEDLHSPGGTWVDNKLVRERTLLPDGCVLRLGRSVLRFERAASDRQADEV